MVNHAKTMVDYGYLTLIDHGYLPWLTMVMGPWLTVVPFNKKCQNHGYLIMVNHCQPWSRMACFAGVELTVILFTRMF